MLDSIELERCWIVMVFVHSVCKSPQTRGKQLAESKTNEGETQPIVHSCSCLLGCSFPLFFLQEATVRQWFARNFATEQPWRAPM